MSVIIHKDDWFFSSRVGSKAVFAERDGWGGEVGSLRNEVRTAKGRWGNGTKTENNIAVWNWGPHRGEAKYV